MNRQSFQGLKQPGNTGSSRSLELAACICSRSSWKGQSGFHWMEQSTSRFRVFAVKAHSVELHEAAKGRGDKKRWRVWCLRLGRTSAITPLERRECWESHPPAPGAKLHVRRNLMHREAYSAHFTPSSLLFGGGSGQYAGHLLADGVKARLEGDSSQGLYITLYIIFIIIFILSLLYILHC